MIIPQEKNSAYTKFAAIAMVKNECDIVELFIKINSRLFDCIYILDHLSDDSTAEIVKKFQALGYPINYILWPDNTFNQAMAITSVVRQVANMDIFDYIIPLDADEFLASENLSSPKELVGSLISKTDIGLIPWKTYCPVSDAFFNLTAPLYENFRMRKVEPQQYYKVILGNEFAKNCSVSEGNHIARSEKFVTNPVILPLILQHVPVRSREQIIRKSILGSYSLALKKNRTQGEGFHWDLMAKQIRDNNYEISQEEIFELALHYATSDNKSSVNEILSDAPRIGTEADSIEFMNLALINPLKSFDPKNGDQPGFI